MRSRWTLGYVSIGECKERQFNFFDFVFFSIQGPPTQIMSPSKMFFMQTTNEFPLAGNVVDIIIRKQSETEVMYVLRKYKGSNLLEKVSQNQGHSQSQIKGYSYRL